MALCSIAIAAGIVGVVAVVKRLVFLRRCGGRGHRGWGWGRHWGGEGGGRGGHRGGIGGSFWLRMLFARVDTTPGQEREIRAAIEDLRDRAKDAKSGMLETRESLGKSVAGETFDDAAFEAVSARVDATSEKMKDALSSALKRIHAVLDPKQRERLAELVSRGAFGRWGRGGGEGGGGPYRSSAHL
jgi:Spy/CpxP family protein refolding chaperone